MTTIPKLFTSSWRSRIDPSRFVLIGISRSVPRGLRGYRRYMALAPPRWFRDPMDEGTWARRYEAEVLSTLDPERVLNDLATICAGRPGALLCWEPEPPDPAWCHRGLVSQWLHERIGFELPELFHEGLGHGSQHPKLPGSLRRASFR